MKRMNKNAIALATAGALTLAVAPAAMAEDLTRDDVQWLPSEAETATDVPTTTASQSFVESNAPQQKPEGIIGGGKAEPTDQNTVGNANKQRPTVAPAQNALCTDENGQKTVWYRHADGLNYVTDPNRTTGALPGSGWRSYKDILEKGDCVFVEDGNVQGPVEPGEAAGPSAGDIAKAVAALAGAAVGTGIIINGVKYFVNKDKKTLVQDPNRVNAEPSAEEKAKSEEVVKANPDAVASQTGAGNAQAGANNAAAPAANGERGIGASTGVNKLPAGILSLLLASLLGAAAFVFGRRQLV